MHILALTQAPAKSPADMTFTLPDRRTVGWQDLGLNDLSMHRILSHAGGTNAIIVFGDDAQIWTFDAELAQRIVDCFVPQMFANARLNQLSPHERAHVFSASLNDAFVAGYQLRDVFNGALFNRPPASHQ